MFSLPAAKAQIALEFVIVYSFVLVLFLVVFGLIVSQRASSISQQEYGSLQLIAQNVAGYIDQAVSSGNGYSAAVQLPPPSQALSYNLSISTTGVVVARTSIGRQVIAAYAYSVGRNLNINGTLNSSMSGQGISVYSLPAASGYISLYNSKGAIFVDEPPVSTLNLPSYLAATVTADVAAASFNGRSSYGYAANSLNLKPASTIGMWVYPSNVQSGAFRDLIGKGTGQPYVDIIGSNQLIAGVVGSANTIPITLSTGVWSYIAVAYSTSGNTITLYLNGKSMATSSAALGITSDANLLAIGSTNKTISPVGGGWFNGSIANIQLYNSTLSGGSISALYSEGIGAQPLGSSGLSGWWPMDGDMQDHSGRGNQMTPSNVSYTNVVQLTARVRTGAGLNAGSDLLGFVASNGTLHQSLQGTHSIAAYTNGTGFESAFVNGNIAGTYNITVNAYSYNASSLPALMGWWPMDEGYGNTIYDLSGSYNNAAFASNSWAPVSANATALEAAHFNGYNSSIDGTLPALISQNMTISAWINGTGSGAYPQNIAEVSGPALSSEAIGINAMSGNAMLSIGGQYEIYGGALAANTTYMVTGVWNGNNKTMSLYVNGTLVSTGSSTSVSQMSANAFNFGGAYGLVNTFNGLISNVQLYNSALSMQQVRSLYGAGLSGSPLPGAALQGWWLLDNTTGNYAALKTNQSAPKGISFKQLKYVNAQGSAELHVPSFNGLNTAQTSTGYPATNSLSVSLWFYSSNFINNYQFPLNSNPQDLWAIGFNAANQIYIYPGNGAGAALASAAVNRNAWNQVAFAAQNSGGSTAYTAYLNGAQIGSGSLSGNIKAVSNLVFGANTFTGQIANVQIYNTTLSQAEVQQIYMEGLPPFARLNVSSGR